MKKYLFLSTVIILTLACTLTATPDSPLTIATLHAQASAVPPSSISPTIASTSDPQAGAPSPTVSASNEPTGKIVFTCQVGNAGNHICLINADGTGFRQLTYDAVKHWYPSLSPDSASVIYSAYLKDYVYEIYEMNLASGIVMQLTDSLGVLKAPEISPDGKSIVFGLGTKDDGEEIWVMNRNGADPKRINNRGWDPSWSPDGTQILFASDSSGSIQLYIMNVNGTGVKRVTDFDALRGRSDWSPDGEWMATYNGPAWKREIFIFRPDFTDVRQLTPAGGNSQGPGFSPDGKWVVFTSYFDHYNDDLGCEIYIIRVDGTDVRRLTDNAYCDYQPRWGP